MGKNLLPLGFFSGPMKRLKKSILSKRQKKTLIKIYFLTVARKSLFDKTENLFLDLLCF